MVQQKDEVDIYKSYERKCSPGVNRIAAERDEDEDISITYGCCNSINCNQQSLPNNTAIECYACDSRVSGLEGCSILNISSPHVNIYASSSPSESCAASDFTRENSCFYIKVNFF